MKFERIDAYHARAKVYGGWILESLTDVMTKIKTNAPPAEGYEWRIASCFIPDPDHKWKLDEFDSFNED